jgi:hypothetical protein
MHMRHHVTNHLIISNDKDSNSENRIKLRVRDNIPCHVLVRACHQRGAAPVLTRQAIQMPGNPLRPLGMLGNQKGTRATRTM